MTINDQKMWQSIFDSMAETQKAHEEAEQKAEEKEQSRPKDWVTKYLVTYDQMEGDHYAGGYVEYQKVVSKLEDAVKYKTVTPIKVGRRMTRAQVAKIKKEFEQKRQEANDRIKKAKISKW